MSELVAGLIIGALFTYAITRLLKKRDGENNADTIKTYDKDAQDIKDKEKDDREKAKEGSDEEAQDVLADVLRRNNDRMLHK
jgi:hypothetical protein